MRKTQTVRDLEAKHKKPIEQIVIEAYNRNGTINGAAAALQVNPNTYYGWVLRLGIRIKTIAEAPAAPAA